MRRFSDFRWPEQEQKKVRFWEPNLEPVFTPLLSFPGDTIIFLSDWESSEANGGECNSSRMTRGGPYDALGYRMLRYAISAAQCTIL
jgi:hypothetical protein